MAAGAQRKQTATECRETREHARRISEPAAETFRTVPVRLPGEAQQLQREDREDAGHGVENHAAEKGQQQCLPPSEAGLSRRCGKRVRADLERAFGAVPTAQHQNAVERRRHGGGCRSFRHRDFEAVGAAGCASFGGVVDQRVIVWKKHPRRVVQADEGAFRNPQKVRVGVGNEARLKWRLKR